jgi:hypothetical protein
MGVVVVLGVAGGYGLYRGLSTDSSSGTPSTAPSKVVQQANASPAPLTVKAPNRVCHLVIVDKDRTSIVMDLEPDEIYEFPDPEFQGTVCAGAEVYVNGVLQTPTPIPSEDTVRFAS